MMIEKKRICATKFDFIAIVDKDRGEKENTCQK